jgi:hypothetical protein
MRPLELLFTGFWGFPAPRNDGDGRVDVYVQPMAGTGALGLAFADAASRVCARRHTARRF